MDKKLTTIIITSLSLVSALAWDSAFQNFFKKNKLINKGGPWLYAIIVTILTVGAISFMENNFYLNLRTR